jgi:hypothetical protein
MRFAVVLDVAQREVRRLPFRSVESGDERVDVGALVESGLLTGLELQSDAAVERMVEFARRIGEGEAKAAAAAIERGCFLATDDRKARRTVLPAINESMILSTEHMVRHWVEVDEVPQDEVRAVLLSIEQRGRFLPSGSSADVTWWHEVRAGTVDEGSRRENP